MGGKYPYNTWNFLYQFADARREGYYVSGMTKDFKGKIEIVLIVKSKL